jgi:hypothetical protein
VASVRQLDEPTLVVAVKADCDGCRAFLEGDLTELGDLEVVLVVAAGAADPSFATAAREVYEAPALLEALDVRWPPFYVLVAPSPPRVLREGVLFSPAQVAREIAEGSA